MPSKQASEAVGKSNQLWQNHQDLVLNLINTLLPEQNANTESEIVEKFNQLRPNHQDLVLELIDTLLAKQEPRPRKKLKKETEPDRTLYLAVHEETFATIFEEALGQLTIRKNDLKLIVFNKTEEVIVKWNA